MTAAIDARPAGHESAAAVEEMRATLRLQLAVRPRWDRPLRRHMTARAVAGSNAIEGYAATVDDVEAMMSGEEPLEASDVVREAPRAVAQSRGVDQ